jgi:hypothetical protein
MWIWSGRRSAVAGSPQSAKKSHRPAGVTMSSIRDGVSPSVSKLCGVDGGTRTKPPGPAISSRSPTTKRTLPSIT